MSVYPPPDNRLAHLIAQELNTRLDTWHFAFLLAEEIVRAPTIQAELNRIGRAHAAGQPCGDRHCATCWQALLTRPTIDQGDHPCTTTPHDESSQPKPPTDSPDAST